MLLHPDTNKFISPCIFFTVHSLKYLEIYKQTMYKQKMYVFPVTNMRGNMETQVGLKPIMPLLPSHGNTWFVQQPQRFFVYYEAI